MSTTGTLETATVEALRRQNDQLRQTIVLCDRLSAMALRGEAIGSITDGFARMLGYGVTVLDPMLAPLASAGWDTADSGGDPLGLGMTDDRLREVLATARGPLRLPAVPGSAGHGSVGPGSARPGCVIAPITVGTRLLGHVAVASPEEPVTGDLDLFAVQHAATVYAQALLEEDRVDAFRLRFKREIFEALLHGQAGGAGADAESARLIGLDPEQAYQVLSVATGDATGLGHGLVLETVASAVGRRWPDLVAVTQDEDLIVVAPPTFSPADRFGNEARAGACLLAFLRNRFPSTGFTVGTSRVITTLAQLGPARDQARATRKLAERLGRSETVTGYEELGFYRLLLAVPPPELLAFADEVLAPAADYDEAHGSDLVNTLSVYLQTGGSPRHAAERLFVHPNTVVYRIGKIESLIGVDLSDPDDRLLCQAAVKAREALEYRDGRAGGGAGAPTLEQK